MLEIERDRNTIRGLNESSGYFKNVMSRGRVKVSDFDTLHEVSKVCGRNSYCQNIIQKSIEWTNFATMSSHKSHSTEFTDLF